jgi:hypothetical protein
LRFALGSEIGGLGLFLHRRDNGLGLLLGEAGLTQPLRDLQGVNRHLTQTTPSPSFEADHRDMTMARTRAARQATARWSASGAAVAEEADRYPDLGVPNIVKGFLRQRQGHKRLIRHMYSTESRPPMRSFP